MAADLTTTWSETESVAWKIAVPGRGWSSPVVAAGRFYLTTAMAETGGADATLHAVCLDAQDGRLLWDTEVLRPDPGSLAAMHRKNSPASATRIVTHDRLYVHFGHMGSAALTLDGNVVWRQTDLGYPPTHGNSGSPVLIDGTLIFNADGQEDPFVAALDANSGKLRWRTPRKSTARKQFSFSTPLVIEQDGAKQVISPCSGFVGAYDPKNGRELWRATYPEGYSVPRPVFAHGLVFVSSSFDQPSIYAVRPQGAAGDVAASHIVWSHKKGAPCTSSMLAVGEELYFVSDGGIATCADARTGTIHWSERLGGDFSASPMAGGSRVYFQNEVGVGYVVKAGRQFELLAKNELRERTLASYAATDGALFIRSEAHLWKIGR